MTVDFETFAARSTVLPRILGEARRVNPVIRFSCHEKSPRDVGPTGSVAQVSGLASVTDRVVDFNAGRTRMRRVHLTNRAPACRVSGPMTTAARTRVSKSPLLGALITVVFLILPL